MSEIGYTTDTGYVDDANDNDDEGDVRVSENYDPGLGGGSGDKPIPGGGASKTGDPATGGGGGNFFDPITRDQPSDLPGSGGINTNPGRIEQPVAGAQPQVEITRDKDGFITKYESSDGRELQVVYGDDHQPIAIVDDKSGSRMIQTDKGWVLETANGDRVPVGNVSIDQESGAISTTFQDGSSLTAFPNGRTVQKDSDGHVTAVTTIDGSGKAAVATARYDENGNAIEIHDTNGTSYVKQNGKWIERQPDGTINFVDGDVSLTDRGVQGPNNDRNNAHK